MNTLVINLFGGAGCGKSTIASGIFYELKKRQIECELASEYAKDLVWEDRKKTFNNQIYIFGKQHHRIFRLIGQVEVIITDSPLLLTPIYDEYKRQPLEDLTIHEFNKCNNLNFLVQRTSGYKNKGRIHTLEEATQIDEKIKNLLEKYKIPFTKISKNYPIQDLIELIKLNSFFENF